VSQSGCQPLRGWLALGITAVTLSCHAQSSDPFQVVEFVPPSNGISIGASNAPIVLVEFGDHVCPVCREFSDSVLPEVRDRYIDSSLVQYRYLEAGPDSRDGIAALVECLSIQIGFLDARKRAFEILASPRQKGSEDVDPECIRSPQRSARRAREREIAQELGVPGTPTFVLGRQHPDGRVVGWVVVGLPSSDSLRVLIDLAAERVGLRSR